MKKTISLINSWYLTITGILSVIILVFWIIYSIIKFITSWNQPEWNSLGYGLYLFQALISVIFVIPSIISGVSGLRYLKGKSKNTISIVASIIGIIFLFFYIFISNNFSANYLDLISEYSIGNLETNSIVVLLFVFILYILPLIINGILLGKKIKYVFIGCIILITSVICINIINFKTMQNNVIEITDNNVHSYSDFKLNLRKRGIELKSNASAISNEPNRTFAFDSTYEYGFRPIENKKYPLLIYNYFSLPDNQSDIKNTEVYIEWYIYYLNNEIYAEAACGGRNKPTSCENNEVIISESKKITVYDSKNNQYINGGCIVGLIGNNFVGIPEIKPKIKATNNSKCIKIKVVDRVDKKTLDNIAKEIIYGNTN